VGFEPTILVLERAKTVRTLDRAATAIGETKTWRWTIIADSDWQERDPDLVREGAQQRQDSEIQTELISGQVPRWDFLDTKTCWLTDRQS
jgi:hypothetical protein